MVLYLEDNPTSATHFSMNNRRLVLFDFIERYLNSLVITFFVTAAALLLNQFFDLLFNPGFNLFVVIMLDIFNTGCRYP